MKTCNFCLTFFVLMLLAASACEENPLQPDGKSRPKIVPVVQAVSTKADGDGIQESLPGRLLSERVVSSKDGFDLIEMVYENNSLPAWNGASTKGSVVTTENISAFNMKVYAGASWYDNTISGSGQGTSGNPYPAGLYFEAAGTKSGSNWGLTKSSGPAKPGDSGELYWLNDVPMTFWSWKYVKPIIDGANTDKGSFNYTVKSDVSQQEDLIYAFSKENRKYYDSGSNYGTLQSQSSTSRASGDEVNIWFYHALSAVQFMQDPSMTDYRISNIQIQNVNGTTGCVMTGSNSAAAAGSPNIAFDHTPGTITSFSQDYTAADLAAGGSLTEPSGTSKFKSADTKTFFMIPQTLGPDAKLKVTFKNTVTAGGEETSPVFDLTGEWLAGNYYVYKINLAGSIKVAISEDCDDTAKSEVRFKNTCNVNEYIRAAVVANWYDNGGNIVAPWTGSITPGSGWTPGSDGFFYHDAVVPADGFTSILIDSFTKPTDAPVTGAHFEMTILVQAVGSDGFTVNGASVFSL